MRIILTDKKLNVDLFPQDVTVQSASYKSIETYNGNPDVVAIAGSRAMAIKAESMNLSGLKFVQLTSAGFDGVPIKKYAERNIPVANAGSVYSVPIAETVVFGMLMISKKIHDNPNNRHFKIQRHYTTITELFEKNVLIMGAGNIGTAVANRLSGFEMYIDGYDPFCSDKPQYREIIRTREVLLQKIDKYDYIISTLPDNEQTQKFINAELFSNMKDTAVIINVGRRAVFNEKDFYQILKSKRIGGAVLDMFEKIPNPLQNKFRRLSNVVVLPGVAAISREVNIRLADHMSKNLQAFLNGKELMNVVNEVK